MQQISLHSFDTAWLLGTMHAVVALQCCGCSWGRLGRERPLFYCSIQCLGECHLRHHHGILWKKGVGGHGQDLSPLWQWKAEERNIKNVDCSLKAQVLCVLAVDLVYRCSSIPEESLDPACLKQFYSRWIAELYYLVHCYRVQCSLKLFWRRLLYIFNILGCVSTEIKYGSQHSIC